jgi:hypothetical protein
MAVAVYDYNVPRGHRTVPNDFVGSTGAVGDKEQMISVKNTGGISK